MLCLRGEEGRRGGRGLLTHIWARGVPHKPRSPDNYFTPINKFSIPRFGPYEPNEKPN